MANAERRRHRRTRLRLRITRMDGLDVQDPGGDLWTCDISSGGMYLRAPVAEVAVVGSGVSFELSVPPGEGYSLSAGRIRGSGKVVRVDAAAEPMPGVAVGFTVPLALDF